VPDRRSLRRAGTVIALAGCLTSGLVLGACGDEGETAPSVKEAADGAAALERALDVTRGKRTAAFTFSVRSENVPRGQVGIEASGGGRIDFPRERSTYRMRYDEAPALEPGTTLDFFSDRAVTFTRPAGRGLFRREKPSIVANGPADSLKYLGTDSIDVRRVGADTVAGRSCTRYAAKLDYARIRRRVPAARRVEFDRQTQGVRTVPFTVCIDAGDVLREYVAEVRPPGGGDAVLRVAIRFSRVGSAERIPRLRASQKAR